jgi:hypothetical protein
MRQAMECLRSVQCNHFYVNSDEFEMAQWGLVAAALLRGESGLFARDFPVTMAASGDIQRDCLVKLRYLFQRPFMWTILPNASQTVEFRADAFILLSRIGCLVEENYSHPRAVFPNRGYLLLKDEGLADEFVLLPLCVLGKRFAEFKKAHPTLKGEALQAELIARACKKANCNGFTESRFAGIRRIVTSRSVQVKALNILDLSAEWTNQLSRIRQSRYDAIGKRVEPVASSMVARGAVSSVINQHQTIWQYASRRVVC